MQLLIDKRIPHLKFILKPLPFIKKISFFNNEVSLAKKIGGVDGIFVSSNVRVREKDFQIANLDKLKIVASATSGVEHLDLDFLKKKKIKFFHARGSNALAVVEYVLTLILKYLEYSKIDWDNLRVGVIGGGEIGGRLFKALKALGIKAIVYDPFIKKYSSQNLLREMKKAQVLSFHVPLTKTGAFPTFSMINEKYLKKILDLKNKLRPLFINTCRGKIFEPKVLKKNIKSKTFIYAFDVWDGEPVLDPFILKNAWIATPHIAGYSAKSKYQASFMLYQQFLKYFKINELDYPVNSYLKKKFKIFNPNYSLIIKSLLTLTEEFTNLEKTSELFKKNPELFYPLRKKYLKRLEFSQVFLKILNKESLGKLEKSHLKFYSLAKELGFKIIFS